MIEDLKQINGTEIIEFLNNLSDDDHEELMDCSCNPPYIFESQEIRKDEYRLKFSAYYNNWGTDQLIEDNIIHITKEEVWVSLEEPFEGDGSSDVLEDLLKKWLKKHKFTSEDEIKREFSCLLQESSDLLAKAQYGDEDILKDVLSKITRAKTLIK